DFQAGFTSRAFGANSFYSPRYPDQYENIRTFSTGIRLSNNNTKTNVSPYFYWRHNRDQFALFRKNPPEWYKTDNYHLTDVKGYGLDLSHSFLTGTLSGGLDFRHEKILSNVLGEILSRPVTIPWEDTLLFTRGRKRFHAGIFLDYSATIRKFYLSAGVMLAFNSGNRTLLSLYPGLDLSYRLSERVRWFASVNRALRLPTFTDLYYNSPVQKGNPSLLPEKAVAIESGIKINYSNLKGNFSFFRRMGKEIIDWVKYPYDSIWISMNHTRVNVNGFEFFIEWKPLKTADEKFSLKSVKLGYGYLNPDKESGEMQSKYSLDVLSDRVDFGMEYSLIADILMSLRLSYRCREGGYQPFENNRYLPEVKYPDTFVADGKISREFKSFNVYVEVTNILNTRYYDNANVPEPGRWIKAGINLRIF
ncbi:MAG: TonB-dependent receptor, partial [Bacteroidales bacterium]|nr:TonB-dependent receptor [Bacteroidales bacterium]